MREEGREENRIKIKGYFEETKGGTMYLPFKGLELFSSRADEALYSIKDLRATLRSLGIYTLSSYKKCYKYQPQQS